MKPSTLTTREVGLLRALVDREGETVTRGQLLQEVWGLRPDTKTRVIDSFIVRLRRISRARPERVPSTSYRCGDGATASNDDRLLRQAISGKLKSARTSPEESSE